MVGSHVAEVKGESVNCEKGLVGVGNIQYCQSLHLQQRRRPLRRRFGWNQCRYRLVDGA